MSSYDVGFYKFTVHPEELTPDDIYALKARDPWLAKRAVDAWRKAQRERWEKVQGKSPNVRPVRLIRIKK